MISINPPLRPPQFKHLHQIHSVTTALCIVLPTQTNPKALHVYMKTEIELRWIFVLFHQQPQRAVEAFTSCCFELPSVYMQDNRHQVPTNSCCSSLLPVARI